MLNRYNGPTALASNRTGQWKSGAERGSAEMVRCTPSTEMVRRTLRGDSGTVLCWRDRSRGEREKRREKRLWGSGAGLAG